MDSEKNIVDLLRNKKKREMVECIARWFLGKRFQIHVSGLENILDVSKCMKSPFILVSNHEGFWDGFLYGVLVPQLDFAIAKEECWLKWLYRFFVPDLGGIPTARPDKLVELKLKYPSSYSRFIDEDGRFRYKEYFPNGDSGLMVEDIKKTVKQSTEVKSKQPRSISSITDFDALVIAEYVLLKGRNLMHFYQGTRRPNHSLEGEKNGLFYIASDLIEFHNVSIPIIPSAVWYENLNKWGSHVGVAFGDPTTGRLLLNHPVDGRGRFFMDSIKSEVRYLLGEAKSMCKDPSRVFLK